MVGVTALGGGPPASLSHLQHLTNLTVGGPTKEEEWRAAAGLLQLAPPSLRELSVSGIYGRSAPNTLAAIVGPPLAALTQLTGLKLGDNLGLLPYLDGMQRLRELAFAAKSLRDDHMPCLAALRSLRRLECGGSAADAAAYHERLKVGNACCLVRA